jgi:hypothetical protein
MLSKMEMSVRTKSKYCPRAQTLVPQLPKKDFRFPKPAISLKYFVIRLIAARNAFILQISLWSEDGNSPIVTLKHGHGKSQLVGNLVASPEYLVDDVGKSRNFFIFVSITIKSV